MCGRGDRWFQGGSGIISGISLEMVALTKRQETDLGVAEQKILKFSFGVTKKEKIRSEYIRGNSKVDRFGDKVKEARQRWLDMCKRGKEDILDKGF